MHRRCQNFIIAAIPRDFPSRPLCIVLLHSSDYNGSQRSSLYGHHIKKLFGDVHSPTFTSTPLFEALGDTSGSQKFTKHLVLPKNKAVSKDISKNRSLA